MNYGVSIFLFATGAILAWAVEADVEGVQLEVVGVILMIVGVVGFLASLAFWGTRRRTVVRERGPDGEVVREERDESLL